MRHRDARDEHERAYEVSACSGREQPHRSGVGCTPGTSPALGWMSRRVSSVAASMYAQRRVVGPGRSAATDISPA